jgi:hypothetical protein
MWTALLMAASVPAQNLFVANVNGVTEITPSGVQSTFAPASNFPALFTLAFNNTGGLFVVNGGANGCIGEITPDGAQSIFASGLSYPQGLAFNSAGYLFVANASGLGNAMGLAFEPVAESSFFGLLAVGAAAFFVRRRRLENFT